jgi:hypothetical protein
MDGDLAEKGALGGVVAETDGGQREGPNELMRWSFLALRTSRAPRPEVDAELGEGGQKRGGRCAGTKQSTASTRGGGKVRPACLQAADEVTRRRGGSGRSVC